MPVPSRLFFLEAFPTLLVLLPIAGLFLFFFPLEAVEVVNRALEDPDPNPGLTVSSWLVRLQTWALEDEMAKILRRLATADPPLRDDEKDLLTGRLRVLQAERGALSPAFSRVAPSRDGLAREGLTDVGPSDGRPPDR